MPEETNDFAATAAITVWEDDPASDTLTVVPNSPSAICLTRPRRRPAIKRARPPSGIGPLPKRCEGEPISGHHRSRHNAGSAAPSLKCSSTGGSICKPSTIEDH